MIYYMSKSTRLGINTNLGSNNNIADNRNFILGSVGARNRANRNALIKRVTPECPCFDVDVYPYIERGISLTSLYIQDDSTFDNNNKDSYVLQGSNNLTEYRLNKPFTVTYDKIKKTLYFISTNSNVYVADISFTPLFIGSNAKHPRPSQRITPEIELNGISTITTVSIAGPLNDGIDGGTNILTINGVNDLNLQKMETFSLIFFQKKV